MTGPEQQSRGEVVAIFSILGTFGIVLLAIVGREWAGSDRADVAQWVMAGASIATLMAAVAAAIFAAGAFRLETHREERYREDQRRQQAERVAAWYETAVEPLMMGGREMPIRMQSHRIKVRNASDLPVTQVEFVIFVDGIQIGSLYRSVLPPTDSPEHVPFGTDLVAALGSATGVSKEESGVEDAAPPVTIDMIFTDAAGTRWTRPHGGRLRSDT